MKKFRRRLQAAAPCASGPGRRWLFIPYDQLSMEMGPLAREEPRELGLVMIENRWQLRRRPFHKQRLALLLANSRHFALEAAARGAAVKYLQADAPYREVLPPVAAELGALCMMTPAERELRQDLEPLVRSGEIELLPHEGWLTSHEDFKAARPSGPPWRMDIFYRYMRKQSGILMQAGKPVGGKYSFDPQNRKPRKGEPPAPRPPQCKADEITEEVEEEVKRDFADHPGRLDLAALPAGLEDSEAFWAWAKRECLPHFGAFEDAMSQGSAGLFHTRLAALINLGRLRGERLIRETAALDIPLESKEAFIRQILGWREFVRHVHLAGDGFRVLPAGPPPVASVPGDGGYARWAQKKWPVSSSPSYLDGGAAPSFLNCSNPLPPAYWGRESGLFCLDRVVADVWQEGWSHHITRLVILSSIATMLEVSPRELTDWFWAAYIDAYDWVVEPNVLGMGTFAVGDYMSTKPYVTGAAYINRMSDYCAA